MADTQITCPQCGFKFSLSDAHKHEFEDMLKAKEKELETEIKKKAFSWAQKEMDEKMKAYEEEKKKKEYEVELLKKRDEEARKKELQFLQEKQALEQKQKDLEIEKQKAILEERKKMEEEFSKKAEERLSLEFEKRQLEFEKKMQEKEKQMDMLKKSLDEATRKANQGSMQIQWETQEEALKTILMQGFPYDIIEDVEKGIRGADLVQNIKNHLGQDVGIIVWESKNTKAWSDSWVEKLKEDRLLVKANIAIIVTSVLPEGVKHFWIYKDVWVTSWEYILPLTLTLRENIIALAQMQNSLRGKDEKMELIYDYLTSADFKAKIENIVDAFQAMKTDLEKEKRAMERIWSSREKQLERVISNTSRLYGDMQGLIGAKNLEKIDFLELPEGD